MVHIVVQLSGCARVAEPVQRPPCECGDALLDVASALVTMVDDGLRLRLNVSPMGCPDSGDLVALLLSGDRDENARPLRRVLVHYDRPGDRHGEGESDARRSDGAIATNIGDAVALDSALERGRIDIDADDGATDRRSGALLVDGLLRLHFDGWSMITIEEMEEMTEEMTI